MKKLAFISTLGCLVSLCASGASAQSYNANGVDSRIIYGGNGLSTPSGSYIGGGTMSQSARGIQQGGPQANPGLPRVSLGANIGTAGDNQYTENRIGAQQNQQQNRRMQGGGGNFSAPSLPSSKWGANIGTAGDAIRSDMNPGYYRSNQTNQQFIQNQLQQQQRYQPPTQIQQMIQSSNGGPLKYEGAGSNHVNY
ncbi:MAG: hypothetical protein HYX67_17110 [Candidatus Melainabacteria bacterium]|nr:hypothetical protein [Candidatus Melainabacteria bacterium]